MFVRYLKIIGINNLRRTKMENYETWSKLLFTYGPYALIVLFIFVVERVLRNRFKQAESKFKKLFLSLYVANWIFIIALVVFSIYAWSAMNLVKEKRLHGTIETLEVSESITSSDDFLYTRKAYYGTDRFTYHLQIFCPATEKSKKEIIFYLDKGSTQIEQAKGYKLTIQPQSYGKDFRILYKRNLDTLVIDSGDSLTLSPLQPEIVQTSDHYNLWDFFIPKAFAQEKLSFDKWKKRLESTDPIIRNNARAELMKLGNEASPFIEKVLSDPQSSYLSVLGVVIALSESRYFKIDQMNTKAISGLIEASIYPSDPKLRLYSSRLLNKTSNQKTEAEYDRMIGVAGSNKERISALMRSELDFLYNYGIKEKDQFKKNTVVDKQHLDRAISIFRKAWNLRKRAVESDRVQFSRALYGWGVALHDKSWIDRKNDGQQYASYVKSAQDKFREFLSSVRSDKNSKLYQYPEHLSQAERYIQNPVPESLKPRMQRK
jgi:hypothetical protein